MDEGNGYNENTFTFRVGASRKPFVVHADIVSRHSKVLSRLIEGPFKESIEKVAELPEVEPEIFGHFLAYAYFMSNGTSTKETATGSPSAHRISMSRIIELLLANRQRKFSCKTCRKSTDLKFSFSFPYCGECDHAGFGTKLWNSRCVVVNFSEACLDDAEYLQGMACRKCLRNLGLLDWYNEFKPEGVKKVQLEPTRRLEELEGFHFDIPLRPKDMIEAMESFPERTYPTSAILSATLPQITRIAIFAHIYQIEPLSQVALMSLYQKLTREPLDELSTTVVCGVTEYVYNSTIGSDSNITPKDRHVLRRMLSEFIATHRGKFLASPTFMELLRQGGELPIDILSATVEPKDA